MVDTSRAPPNSLNIEWTFGFNKDAVNGVHSLAAKGSTSLFYFSGHTGVIYDYAQRRQTLLQGHSNCITCACVSRDKRYIATADRGPNSVIVVWDAQSGTPIKTFFDLPEHGIAAMDMSDDSCFLATISHVPAPTAPEDPVVEQVVNTWAWTDSKKEGALYTATVPSISGSGAQHCIKFNPWDNAELVTNSPSRVMFWNMGAKVGCYSPKISKRDFQQNVSNFTQSLFISATAAITATEDGDIVQWDQSILGTDGSGSTQRKALKIIRLLEGKAILFLCIIDDYVVTGTADGAVRFYDLRFRLVAWFEDLKAGPVVAVSFSALRPSVDTSPGGDPDAFSVPDFVVGTRKALIVGVDASVFEEVDVENRRGVLLVQGIDSAVRGLAANPVRMEIAVSAASGSLQLWDLQSKRLLMVNSALGKNEKAEPVSLTYDPRGQFLVQGLANGVLQILSLDRLTVTTTFRNSTHALTDIRFSDDSVFLAVADTNYCVMVYRYSDMEENEDGEDWVYLGKHRAHTAPITGLEFATSIEGPTLLVSVAEDGFMAEYDLGKSSVKSGVVLKRDRLKISSMDTPTACFWHPVTSFMRDDVVVTTTNNYKFHLWSMSKQKCRQTVLAPTYAGPINRMMMLPQSESGYLVYSTREKVIGLIKLPLDGNPNKSMGLIAHPGEISNITTTQNGKYLLSAGSEDMTVNVWAIDTHALDTAVMKGGSGVHPYLALLEGGAEGELYDELKDYFYYSQMRTHGENSTKKRPVTGRIPLSEIPNVMRALGHYPTKNEVNRMCYEIQYHEFDQTGQVAKDIGLHDFVKLYVNHRPVYGISKDDITDAFDILAKDSDTGGADEEESYLTWAELKHRLQTEGEAISDGEMDAILKALVGDSTNLTSKFAEMTSTDFADTLLGFDGYDDE